MIVSGGFKEIGNEGAKLEQQIKKKIQGKNLRVIGPNCIGVFDPTSHVGTLFLPTYKLKRPKRGSIAFISQSGARMPVRVCARIFDGFYDAVVGLI